MNFGVGGVNWGKTGKMLVDTPESWHTVCLIFGRVGLRFVTDARSYKPTTFGFPTKHRQNNL